MAGESDTRAGAALLVGIGDYSHPDRDRLNHPNAVRVYDARIGQDFAFIEMEYVPGKSLDQLLEPGKPMPLDWVADLLDELLTGYRPFEGSINAIIYKQTMVPPQSFAEINPTAVVPPPVEQVVIECLAKAGVDRPQSPRELAQMFHQALVLAAPPGSSISLSPSASTPSALTWVLGLLARLRRSHKP